MGSRVRKGLVLLFLSGIAWSGLAQEGTLRWTRQGRLRAVTPLAQGARQDLGPAGTGRVFRVGELQRGGLSAERALRLESPRERPLRSPWLSHLIQAGLLRTDGGVEEGSGRFVVIAGDGLSSALQPLVDLRARQGWRVDVVPVSSVGTEFQKVRDYLRFLAISETPPVAVLLVGEADAVPPARTADGSPSDWLLALPDDASWLAAFPIGRLPARDSEDAALQVSRILAWERDVAAGPAGQWLARASLVSSSMGAGGPDDDEVCDTLARHLEALDQEPPDRLYRSLGLDRPDLLVRAFEEGRGLVAYLGHGDGLSWATMNPPFDREAVRGLRNAHRTPVVLDVSCANGRFDLDESLAEALLRQGTVEAPAGAVAVLSATGDTPWDEPALLAEGILQALAVPRRPFLGEALEEARVRLVADLGPTAEVREVLEKTVLLGDPLTPFRMRAPASVFVQAPEGGGAWTWRAEIRQGPRPLPGMAVALTSRDGEVRRQVTQTMGRTEFALFREGFPWSFLVSGPDRLIQEGDLDLGDDHCGVLEADPPVFPCIGTVVLRLWGRSEASLGTLIVLGEGLRTEVPLEWGEDGVGEALLSLGPGALDFRGPIAIGPADCPGLLREFSRDCEAPRVVSSRWRMLDPRRLEWTLDLDEEAYGEAGLGTVPGVEGRRRQDQGIWVRFVFADLAPGQRVFATLRLWDRAGNLRLLTGPEWSFEVPACMPDCSGRVCGEDGCGGDCGPGCEAGQSCRSGRCEGGPGCDWWYLPGSGARCEACVCALAGYCCTERWDDACSWRCEALCGGCGTGCQPDCRDRNCGENGCGGTCGRCPSGRRCDEEGRCVPECLADCGDRECGDDGCGGACGLCLDSDTGEYRDDLCQQGRCAGSRGFAFRDLVPRRARVGPGNGGMLRDIRLPDEVTDAGLARDTGGGSRGEDLCPEQNGLPEDEGGVFFPEDPMPTGKGRGGGCRQREGSGVGGVLFLLAAWWSWGWRMRRGRWMLGLLVLAVWPGLSARAQGPSRFEDIREKAVARIRIADAAGALALVEATALPSTPRDRAMALWIRARALNDLGRREEARTLLRDLPDDLPPHLREVLEEQRARAAEGAPEGEAVIRGFLHRHPDSPLAVDLRLALARTLLEQGDLAGARAAAEEVLRKKPHRPLRAEAMGIQAATLPSRERAALIRKVFLDLPETPEAERSGLREQDLSVAELERRAQGFDAALDYTEAQRIREALWARGRRSPSLAMTLARSHLVLVRDDPARALDLLRFAEAGGALKGPDRHLWHARALARLERYEEAAAHYRAYLKEGGRAERDRALYYLGWLPYDHGRYEEALPHFDRFLRQARRSRDRSYVAWFKAWSLYQLKRYPEALEALQDMVPMGNNLVAGKALYWIGRIHALRGEERQAREALQTLLDRYPLSYYAVLAAHRQAEWWGLPLPAWMVGPSPGLPEPGPFWPTDRLPSGLARSLEVVRDLADLGEMTRARRVWKPIARAVTGHFHGEDRLRLLTTVLGALEEDHELFRTTRDQFGHLQGRIPTPANAHVWKALYPRARRPLVEVLSERFQFPEFWAYAIMRQESRYDARQVSHTAALGIMQMIPSTARRIAQVLQVPFDVEGFFDSGRNLLFCTRFLGILLPEFRQQILFASAAYNSGAPAIRRFLRERQGLPFDEMVESIPYNEGRNYARKVAEHLVRYLYLYLPPEDRSSYYEVLFPAQVDYQIGDTVDF